MMVVMFAVSVVVVARLSGNKIWLESHASYWASRSFTVPNALKEWAECPWIAIQLGFQILWIIPRRWWNC